jgi:hypothetical protein
MRSAHDRTAKNVAATAAVIAGGVGLAHWLSTHPHTDSRHYWLLWTLSVLGLLFMAAVYFFGAFEVWSYIHHTTPCQRMGSC